MDELSVQLYGSFRGKYSSNLNQLGNPSLTESSIGKYPSKSGFASEYVHSHTGKHTHKKRNSNKETGSKSNEQ